MKGSWLKAIIKLTKRTKLHPPYKMMWAGQPPKTKTMTKIHIEVNSAGHFKHQQAIKRGELLKSLMRLRSNI